MTTAIYPLRCSHPLNGKLPQSLCHCGRGGPAKLSLKLDSQDIDMSCWVSRNPISLILCEPCLLVCFTRNICRMYLNVTSHTEVLWSTWEKWVLLALGSGANSLDRLDSLGRSHFGGGGGGLLDFLAWLIYISYHKSYSQHAITHRISTTYRIDTLTILTDYS